ncbi:MAG: ABC transporter permease [Chloroflexi bacterium]|nr:ABC transporter permease [Chloroflexota bacterium]MDA1270227.1 ABC transporter permease [Chloroflexota bacterium]PKB59618.1 MAG: hypothetical protein BZY83_00995 [SAR202 cluster bacterium Casp-Chloro-G2]
MHKYVAKRLLYSIPGLFGITIIIFFALRILPGDPLTILYGDGGRANLTDADVTAIKHDLGLDKSLVIQYGEWLQDIFTGKMGESFWRGDSVSEMILRRGPLTAEIAVIAVLVSWLIGLPVGIIGAIRQNSIADYVTRFFTIIFLAVPSFWVAILVVVFSLLAFNYRPPLGIIQIWENPIANLQIVLAPGIVLGLATSAYIARMARTTLLEVIRDDYVRTARAKGLSERTVVLRHALRNALLPVITLSGVLFGLLLGGSVAVEAAFTVPGLGSALVQAFSERDFVVVQNLVLLYGIIFVLVNLSIDLAYAWLDPRIRYN